MQLRFSPIINLLSTCRCVQLSAAADDDDGGDLARILCWSGACFELGTVPGVRFSLQEPPGEHQGAAEKREFHFRSLFASDPPGSTLRLCSDFPPDRKICVSASCPAVWW